MSASLNISNSRLVQAVLLTFLALVFPGLAVIDYALHAILHPQDRTVFASALPYVGTDAVLTGGMFALAWQVLKVGLSYFKLQGEPAH